MNTQDCIENCTECHDICLETLGQCYSKGGHAKPEHLRLLQDCADICRVSADLMLRQSPLHVHTCGACAEICAACAEKCESMSDDEQMQRCAEACRECADSCREMAGAGTA